MQTIKMLPELMKKIRSGEKIATTRLGLKNYTLGPVHFVNCEDASDVIDEYHICKLELLAFCDLSDELAKAEGYKNATELRTVIKEIYKDVAIDDYYSMTIVHFGNW